MSTPEATLRPLVARLPIGRRATSVILLRAADQSRKIQILLNIVREQQAAASAFRVPLDLLQAASALGLWWQTVITDKPVDRPNRFAGRFLLAARRAPDELLNIPNCMTTMERWAEAVTAYPWV